ncbi:BglG family transcription antiterminator [Bacillus sp. OTU530]|uniref:BglG family transcription antiterminator n=1 Tax=Bacillus sp. OTU530 TaxID=3043862 RepID=UPI00313D993D
MNQELAMINSRQKELIGTLLLAKKPISYEQLADIFKVSVRTIQREVTSLKSVLKYYDLKIGRKIGFGIELKGSVEGRERLEEHLGQIKALSAYSPEERWEGIAYELLLSKEPMKQFVFGSHYGVTEATISNDLDKVAVWLQKGNIELARVPGIGVYVKGTEQQRRTMLSYLLHKDIAFEEWLELFYRSKQDESSGEKDTLGSVIRNRLLKFVHTPNILVVEQAVHKALREKQSSVELTDRNYVNLIVHLMLAVERIKHDRVIEESTALPNPSIDEAIYSLAEKIVSNIENELAISIPNIEVNYIALHLAGAQLLREQMIKAEEPQEFEWLELTSSFIHTVEYYLGESFEGDELLLEGLVSHFVPAFNRLKLGLQIHNPMLEKIRDRYPEIFIACEKACMILTEKTGYSIPEGEIGYLAMHIGAAMLRKKEMLQKDYRAVVVCASGLGTSTYLASQLRTEIPNLKIEGVISVNQIQEWIQDHGSVDIFISTIVFPPLENENIVIVSPFLRKEDVSRIQSSLKDIPKQRLLEQKEAAKGGQQLSMMSLARFGEAMVQILRNVAVIEDIQVKGPILATILNTMQHNSVVCEYDTLYEDIERRERQGSFVLDDLAMIHARSEGVTELLAVVFRTRERVKWRRDDNKEQLINTFLLLVVPKDAPKEHVKMLSKISSMLIEESFLTMLKGAPLHEVKATLDDVLSKAYAATAKGTLKGLSNR